MLKPAVLIAAFSLYITLNACQKEVNIAASDLKALGSSAHDLLSADSYTSLTIEIDYMPGFEPDAASLQQLQTFLNSHINKPAGIRIVSHAIGASNKAGLTVAELVKLEKHNRSVFTLDSTLAVYILIADAANTDDASILALSYWNTSTALMGKTIAESSGGQGQVSQHKLMTTLLEHEFGHLMGLVDQCSPMQTPHRDETNGAHCSNPTCLMYYGIETAGNMSIDAFISSLDEACLADLKANGGR